ncbi:MAG TPA: dual specificity protein phosphatase family protein [Gemmataceae bacterium]|nr:dual specificity protein phosphatase family protein [Gemmataceae bacterium]
MPRIRTLVLSTVVVLLVIVWPIVEYRRVYADSKRLREVDPGRVYRAGQMTADGFADAVARFKIRTVLNLQDDFPDPDICRSFWDWSTIKESELCRQLGVRYVLIKPDLIPRRHVPVDRPEAVDEFLDLMDRPDTYPVLIHCKAGLHRTGELTAVYRMEYQNWTPEEAYDELKANGFGDWACTSANDYVNQYVLQYRRGLRHIERDAAVQPDAAWMQVRRKANRSE